jgi:2-amino-4-hydroxy-6-hydroxymethyldihydropteridine diphosphokinase
MQAVAGMDESKEHVASQPAAIALGSNQGDRAGNLRRALELLSGSGTTAILRVSPFLQTAPVPTPNAKGPLGGPYLNAACVVDTTLDPRSLLDLLLSIERSLGRTRDPANRSAPRTIDLDLLLYADRIIDEPGLIVPHPRMHLRRFVLDPLAHVAPSWTIPTLDRSVSDLFISLPPDEPANNQA